MSNTNEQNEQNDHVEQSSDGLYADEIIQGHTYDGIQEYDNPMPLWWKAVFVVTVIWSPIYIGLLEMGYIGTYQDQLREEDTYWEDIIAKQKAAEPELTPEKVKEEIDNKDRIASGKEIFAANCAACHGQNGEGVIGPNLTDKYWLHGGDENSIFHTITNGVTEKGMPAWGPVLGQKSVLDVAAFIHSLKNTNVKGKEPQGEPYVEDGDDAAGGDAKPADGDAQAADGDAKPADGDAQAADGDAKPADGDAQAADGDTKPADGDAKADAGDAAPADDAAKPVQAPDGK